MTRIFSVLALLSVGLLIANVVVGLRSGDYNAHWQQLRELHARLSRQQSQVPTDVAAIDQLQQQIASRYEQLRPLRRHLTVHMLLGVIAVLVAVLVNSISVTYFIGTSRWCKEVTAAYDLGPELAGRSVALKRGSFPWALLGISVAVGIATLGAAADPGTLRPGTAAWVMPHAAAAILGTMVIGSCLRIQHSRIGAHHGVIREVLTEVARIRRQRGLP